jgi:Thioredoxin
MTTSSQILDYSHYVAIGIDYPTYLKSMEDEATAGGYGEYGHYVVQNWQRVKRISKTLQLLPAISQALAQITAHRTWLVITEHWCGDAAQVLPVLAAVAAASGGKIDLKLVYRDQHLPLIDAHQTNQTRSIPKLVVLDENLQLLLDWGPRPAILQNLREGWKIAGKDQHELHELVHSWYAKDKTLSTQQEIFEIIKQ